MMTAGLAFSAIGFTALGAEAFGQWYRLGEPMFLPVAAIAWGAALITAGLGWQLLIGGLL